MHFTIIARDSTAEGTLARRMAVRDEHLRRVDELRREGRIVDGGAILDDKGDICGSVVICDYPDRQALDAYIESEVYVREGIWENIDILEIRLLPRL